MKGLIAIAAALSLTACTAADPCDDAQNPRECRAWTDAGGDVNDYLVGGMIGYMLASRGGQTVIVQDPSYRGSYRSLRRPIPDARDQVIRAQQAKINRQRTELRRQQAANRRHRAAARSSASRSSFRSGGRR